MTKKYRTPNAHRASNHNGKRLGFFPLLVMDSFQIGFAYRLPKLANGCPFGMCDRETWKTDNSYIVMSHKKRHARACGIVNFEIGSILNLLAVWQDIEFEPVLNKQYIMRMEMSATVKKERHLKQWIECRVCAALIRSLELITPFLYLRGCCHACGVFKAKTRCSFSLGDKQIKKWMYVFHP